MYWDPNALQKMTFALFFVSLDPIQEYSINVFTGTCPSVSSNFSFLPWSLLLISYQTNLTSKNACFTCWTMIILIFLSLLYHLKSSSIPHLSPLRHFSPQHVKNLNLARMCLLRPKESGALLSSGVFLPAEGSVSVKGCCSHLSMSLDLRIASQLRLRHQASFLLHSSDFYLFLLIFLSHLISVTFLALRRHFDKFFKGSCFSTCRLLGQEPFSSS